jgi:hypothetical protein
MAFMEKKAAAVKANTAPALNGTVGGVLNDV